MTAQGPAFSGDSGPQHSVRSVVPLEEFLDQGEEPYALLPFRFLPFDSGTYLLTNFAGEHLILPDDQLRAFVRRQLPADSRAYEDLKACHFLIERGSTVPIDLLSAKVRTRYSRLTEGTALFMLVVTLRCDHSCIYCHASRQAADRHEFDMSPQVAAKAVEFVFRGCSRQIKIEFQGGEPLLHFEAVRQIVCEAERRNASEGRDLEFVLATNLSALTDTALAFCLDHRIQVSTSLDGPEELHNRNRPRIGGNSYQEAIDGIRRAQEVLGPSQVAALMTVTRDSLSCPQAIVNEYVRRNLSSVFLRILNPYGKSAHPGIAFGYTVEEWLAFYREALSYILELNHKGTAFREEYAGILLGKILTPYATGFVDLQSPAGLGIAGIVVNYDGNVYPSDESRMLAAMGDDRFRMGNVLTDSYRDIMLYQPLVETLGATMVECTPQCSECAVGPYCGSDPVRHYRLQGDVVGFKPTSEFCRKTMEVIKHLIGLLEHCPAAAKVLRSWA